MPKRIQRRRTKGWRMPEGAVYVGRGSRWGNPYRIDRLSQYEAVVLNLYGQEIPDSWGGPGFAAQFATDAYREMVMGSDVTELAGKDLACWCPLNMPCHADVLLEIANMADDD